MPRKFSGPAQKRDNLLKAHEAEHQSAEKIRRKQAKLKRSLARLRSGKPSRPPLRDATRDDRIAKGIGAALRDAHRVRLTSKAGQGVTDYRSRERRFKAPKGTSQDITFWTPTWDHAGDALKALAWSQVMYQVGGETISLNLGPEVIEAAHRSPEGFVPFLQDRIRRRLAKVGQGINQLPEFFLFVEAAYGVEPHLHGAMILPEAPTEREAWIGALIEAGGDYQPRKNQLRIKRYTSPAGWAGYVTKWKLGTAIQIGDDRVCTCSNRVRSAARRWYEEARRSGCPIS
jgi:hypothetical protein